MMSHFAILVIADARQFPPAVFLASKLVSLIAGRATVLLATDWEPGLSSPIDGVELLDIRGIAAGLDLPLVEYFTRATYFSLFVPGMLRDRFDRILYLDVDTYPETSNIFDLFGLDLGSHPIAAVRDLIVPFWPNAPNQGELRNTLGASGLGAKYLNSGVLLFDLARWSDRRLERKALRLIRSRRVPLRYPDQSVFNAILLMDWLELSPSFNMVTRAWASFIRVFAPPQIVHFTGPIKPWHADFVDPHPARDEIRAFLRASPWAGFGTERAGRGELQLPVWRGQALEALLRYLRRTKFADVEQGLTKLDWTVLPRG